MILLLLVQRLRGGGSMHGQRCGQGDEREMKNGVEMLAGRKGW